MISLCLADLDERRLPEMPGEDCVAYDTAKEQLAGFYMIEAKELDEAIRLASGIPPARVGGIEMCPIRPIRETVAAARANETTNECR